MCREGVRRSLILKMVFLFIPIPPYIIVNTPFIASQYFDSTLTFFSAVGKKAVNHRFMTQLIKTCIYQVTTGLHPLSLLEFQARN